MWKTKQKLQPNASEALKGEDGYTFLAKGVVIEGIAKLEGIVRIDGHFNGAINTNDTLIIGEQAVIRGSITADEIICSGKIEANLTAIKRIHLLKPAVVIGDISTPCFTMEDGVLFQGQCDMGMSSKIEWLSKDSQVTEKMPALIPHGELVSTS